MRTKAIDLETIAKSLDLTPTMYCTAIERYTSIANYLKSKNIDAAFYSQGSFRLGTVVRPMNNDEETDFDIDVVCELQNHKETVSPAAVKASVGMALKENETYRKLLLSEQDRCWTLAYSEFGNGIGLQLDVVPSVHEDPSSTLLLKSKHVSPQYADEAISITEKNKDNTYSWQASNPKGYGLWFDSINQRFIADGIQERKRAIFMENRALFSAKATIDDVPNQMVHSSLQRVIQLLKRHRDIFYFRAKKGDMRPISAIITTLATQIAQSAPSTKLDELLPCIINGLKDYALLLQGHSPVVRVFNEQRDYIQKQNQKWRILNPVNPDDNYADTWTDETAKIFFMWIDSVINDLVQPSVLEETRYFSALRTGLGTDLVTNSLHLSTPKVTTPIISRPTQPWNE